MTTDRIYVAGHTGLVGSAIVRALRSSGYKDPILRTHEELELRDQHAVRQFIRRERPNAIFLAAGTVGGISANNTYRWDFIYNNLLIETNVIGAAHETDVERLVFLGSSCIYPKLAPQPITEDALLTSPLEPTNEPYAIAKIAGVKLIEAALSQFGRRWVSLMPTNLYGPGDNYHASNSHVIPGMMRKFYEAKLRIEAGEEAVVTLWGTGIALREFLHVDDLAKAALFMLTNDVTGIYNVGSGEDLSIRDLSMLIASIVVYTGKIEWDPSVSDGTPRKLLDSSRMRALGWAPTIGLRQGLTAAYERFLSDRLATTR